MHHVDYVIMTRKKAMNEQLLHGRSRKICLVDQVICL